MGAPSSSSRFACERNRAAEAFHLSTALHYNGHVSLIRRKDDTVSKGLPSHWKRLHDLSRKRLEKSGGKIAEARDLADGWLRTYGEAGHLRHTPRAALEAPLHAWVLFFQGLADELGVNGPVPSPVGDESDPGWMQRADYCFLNARATSLDPEKTGTFLESMKLLPGLRVSSIHLAPFFDCVMDSLYAVDSHRVIADAVVDLPFEAEGLEAGDQLRCLIDAIHLTGKTVGFDLEPHTSQFSRIVLENPDYFRWIHLAKDRKSLHGKVDMATMMKTEAQAAIAADVRRIVGSHLKAHGMSSVEDPAVSTATVRSVHQEVIQELIREGYWTVPSHTWGGAGLPAFREYHADGYPLFDYVSVEGEDHNEHAFGMLTPFRFFDGLPINAVPTEEQLPVANEKVLDFFARIFPRIQERYDFDYVRLDYVDHVFDSVLKTHPNLPLSDRPIPPVLKKALSMARDRLPQTGAMAERMGTDLEEYAALGFELLLGVDILSTVHAAQMAEHFALGYAIEELNADRDHPASILYALDTHDSGHPLFWTKPVSEVMGSEGMLRRQFVARFGSAGLSRRPKYECMGNADLSHGLYTSNNKPRSLEWKGDETHCGHYHDLEDLYELFRDLMDNGRIGEYTCEPGFARWFVNRVDGVRERLLCLLSLEHRFTKLAKVVSGEHCDTDEDLAHMARVAEARASGGEVPRALETPLSEKHPIPFGVPEELTLDVLENYAIWDPEVVELKLGSRFCDAQELEAGNHLRVKGLGELGLRLFWIRDRSQPSERSLVRSGEEGR